MPIEAKSLQSCKFGYIIFPINEVAVVPNPMAVDIAIISVIEFSFIYIY